MLRAPEPKIMKMTNVRLGSSIGGCRAPWIVPNNINNVSPQYVMMIKVGEKTMPVQCRFWAMGNCTNPNCKFFHGPVETEDSCPYGDTLVNCGVYAQNIPPTVSVDELAAVAKKEGGELYLNDPRTGSKGVKIPKSKKEDGTCAAFINFTKAKAGKAFVEFLNKNLLKGSVIRAKINSIDEIETPKSTTTRTSPTPETPRVEQQKRVKRKQVVDEDGFSVAGRNGKAKSRAVCEPEPPVKLESRPQTPTESIVGAEILSFDELVEVKQNEKKQERLPTHSGTWYSKKHIDDDDDNTGKKKKNKRVPPSPIETKKLFESETEKRRAKDGNWYTKQEFYDYYAMVEGVQYAFEQWQNAVRDTKVTPELSWLGALRPDIMEMQNAEIDAWGAELEAKLNEKTKTDAKTEAKTESRPSQVRIPVFTPKPTPVASTSSDNLPQEVENDINSTSYNGFIQQFENDDDDVEVDFADDEIFSSYVTMLKRKRYSNA